MIHFHNSSSQNVIISINGEDSRIIKAGESITYQDVQGNSVNVCLRHVRESYIKAKKVYMQIETNFELECSNVTDFYIAREKMCVASGVCYDCFMLMNGKNTIAPVRYKVSGEEQLKNGIQNSKFVVRFYETFVDMIDEILLSPIACLVIGGIIVWIFGWKGLLIALGCMYLMCFVGTYTKDKVSKLLGKLFGEKFKQKTMKEQIEHWSDVNTLTAFYANPNRKPYVGKIER